jgi:hypothetical protein
MSTLQIKGIDDALYTQIKALAASENRSVSQQILYLVRCCIANKKQFQKTKSRRRFFWNFQTPGQIAGARRKSLPI